MDHKDYKELTDQLTKEYFFISRGAFWSFLGGAVAFLGVAGYFSYETARESIKKTIHKTIESQSVQKIVDDVKRLAKTASVDASVIEQFRAQIIARKDNIPKGTICAWSSKTLIPDGWTICDGTHGTPNLIDRFLRGSRPNHVLESGGSSSHSHKFGRPETGLDETGFMGERKSGLNAHRLASITESAENTPPYINLIFIMKL